MKVQVVLEDFRHLKVLTIILLAIQNIFKNKGSRRNLPMEINKAQDSIKLIQTAEAALRETHSILSRMKGLAVQATNDTSTYQDRQEIQEEIDKLVEEITRISTDTKFNTKTLLDGNFKAELYIGANENQNISLEIGDMSAKGLNLANTIK